MEWNMIDLKFIFYEMNDEQPVFIETNCTTQSYYLNLVATYEIVNILFVKLVT